MEESNKKKTSWFSSIGNKLKATFQSANNEYKLSPLEVPDFYKVASAHRELLQAYADALAAVSRLSFFVGMNEVKPPEESFTTKIIRFVMWGRFSPFRLLIWRPIVKLYVEAHIHKKLKELATGYAQTNFLIPALHHQESNYLTWLKKAQIECEQFATTVASGRIFIDTIQFLSFAGANLLVAAWGANSIFDLVTKITSAPPPTPGAILLGKFIVFTFFAIPFLLTFLNATFSAKRAIFLNINLDRKETNSVYELENNLFSFLYRGKSREFPVDYIVGAFYYFMFLGYLWLIHLAISQLSKQNTGTIFVDWTWCLIIPYVFIFFSEIVMPWWKRANKGEM